MIFKMIVDIKTVKPSEITKCLILNELKLFHPLMHHVQGTMYALTNDEWYQTESLSDDEYWEFTGTYLLCVAESEGWFDPETKTKIKIKLPKLPDFDDWDIVFDILYSCKTTTYITYIRESKWVSSLDDQSQKILAQLIYLSENT
jgi:hypothetical protein